MGNRTVITKEQVLDAAYAIAIEEGIGALSIRAVARACDVAVGTVYHSYPTKSDLVNDVIARFWRDAFANVMRSDGACDDDFITFCHMLGEELSQALERFRSDFLADLTVMDACDLAAARQREAASFAHVRQGLRMALERDRTIDRDRLTGPLAPEQLCDLVWETLLAAARSGKPLDATLLTLIATSLRSIEEPR